MNRLANLHLHLANLLALIPTCAHGLVGVENEVPKEYEFDWCACLDKKKYQARYKYLPNYRQSVKRFEATL